MLTLYNANTSQSEAQDLQTMARTIEKEVTIGTDMPESSKWEEEEEEQNTDLDCDEILEDVYNEKNESYKVFQLARHVRELAKI